MKGEAMGKVCGVLLCVGLAGCLLGKPAAPARYFRPEIPQSAAAGGSPSDGFPGSGRVGLHLDHVVAVPFLGERIVWRSADGEYGYYEARRWIENPARFVEQEMVHQLFDGAGLQRVRAGRVTRLRVTLTGFEEQLEPVHAARIELRVVLVDPQHLAQLDRSYEQTVRMSDGTSTPLSQAMGRALSEVVKRVVMDVAQELGASRQGRSATPPRRVEQSRP